MYTNQNVCWKWRQRTKVDLTLYSHHVTVTMPKVNIKCYNIRNGLVQLRSQTVHHQANLTKTGNTENTVMRGSYCPLLIGLWLELLQQWNNSHQISLLFEYKVGFLNKHVYWRQEPLSLSNEAIQSPMALLGTKLTVELVSDQLLKRFVLQNRKRYSQYK